MPHYQSWGGVLYPYFWLLKWGVNLLQDFEYIYCVNGDMILEKPEGFPKLLELLGDGDIMGTGPNTDRIFNTAGFIVKTSSFKKIMNHFEKHLIPFDVYEKYTQEFGNTEGRFKKAIKDLNLKEINVIPPATEQLFEKGCGTWYELLGFRHIHAEHNYAYRHRGIPPEFKYFDERYLGCQDKKYLKLYDETKDKKILEEWYARQ
jgi:hypothetical protein